ncbi:hypothetical protein FVE85_2338 [Porphyridium purpureum]|uniref:Uncharacterized protein n=1 Tax=Porphyridium purpureum TaxID=35688 RepID=A0A5J4Z041_PORPP|nr:hypothetical protein FVE85_2338 [Porphyridium purpureum]|eukprot:POR5984..scf209_3
MREEERMEEEDLESGYGLRETAEKVAAERDVRSDAGSQTVQRRSYTRSDVVMTALAGFASVKSVVARLSAVFAPVVDAVSARIEVFRERRRRIREEQERRLARRRQQRIARKQELENDDILGDGDRGDSRSRKRKSVFLGAPGSTGFLTEEELEAELRARRETRQRERDRYLRNMKQEKLEKLESQMNSLRQKLGTIDMNAMQIPDLESLEKL